MASVEAEPSTPPRGRYSTFRRPSTLESPKNPDTNVPIRLTQKMKDVGLSRKKPVRDFAHWAAQELQGEEKRYNSVLDRLSALEQGSTKLQEKIEKLEGDEIPKLQGKIRKLEGDEIPKLQEELKEIPKLRERIQMLEDESKEIRGVTTKGLFASIRELINWGMNEETVINKAVQAYNENVAARGEKEIEASDITSEARVLMPFLHLGIHVSDMLDWNTALTRTTNNLTGEYSVGLCLAETAFEQVFGYHPNSPLSATAFQNEHGKSNYNLASSLILSNLFRSHL
jgi:hypothetical protein